MKPFDLDQPIFELLSRSATYCWTVRNAVEGVQIFGGIGSGKTSGSGRMLALKYLRAGFGGLVLTVKPDEKLLWQQYCQTAGRTHDLVVIEPDGNHRFNFLEYESSGSQRGAALTENIVDVLKTVIRAGEAINTGKSDDPFWETALDMLIFNVIDLCQLAYGEISVQRMYDIVQGIPRLNEDGTYRFNNEENNFFHEAMTLAKDRIVEETSKWYAAKSVDERDAIEDSRQFEASLFRDVPQARLYKFVEQFFTDNFIPLSERTRSIIDFTFSGFLFRLLREPIFSLFCDGTSTVTPEDSLKGKIILLNLPVKLYHKVGRDCQILFKYIWQRAMEKRDISKNGIPLFLWADEAQNFLHEHDADYQATARSSRISTVYISQNLPNYYACMGGAKAEFRVKSFLGTLGTKIFHANADIETNRYASELIGDAFFEDQSETVTIAKDFSQSRGKSLKLERAVRPEEFVSLRTGGALNNYNVEGYIHRQGDVLAKGLNYAKMTFNQSYTPH